MEYLSRSDNIRQDAQIFYTQAKYIHIPVRL